MGKLGGKYATLSEKRQERSNTVFCSSWTPHNQMKSLNTKKLKNNITRKINKLRFLDVDTYHRLTEAPIFSQIIQIMQIVANLAFCALFLWKFWPFPSNVRYARHPINLITLPFKIVKYFELGGDWEKILMWGNSPFFSRFWIFFFAISFEICLKQM